MVLLLFGNAWKVVMWCLNNFLVVDGVFGIIWKVI